MSAIDWKSVNSKLPVSSTPEDKSKRNEIFGGFDPNGNGYLSLAELDKGIRDILGLDEIFDCKPAIMRAYQSARTLGKPRDKHSEDYIERSEFRRFLTCLRQYFEFWAMFQMVDTSDDRRISFEEFEQAVGLLASWGVTVADPAAAFATIDKNGGGVILFDEFAEWAMKQNLDLEDD